MKKVVIALGGNALGENPREQKELVKIAASAIYELVVEGYEVAIVHGNGPQVGMINNAFAIACKKESKIPLMPLAECGSMTQGYCGYHLQQAIQNKFLESNIKKNVVTVVTQTLVDLKDCAFNNPTKPVGPFYTKEEAEILSEKGIKVIEDSGRGYREVVPSPLPKDIIEKDIIKELVENKSVVICGGGGGIPVTFENNRLDGIAAVIDKDSTAALLAEIIEADIFIILTAVDKVAINFGKSSQEDLDIVDISLARKYISELQFPAGSMLPKINAAINFVERNHNKTAIIGSLEKVGEVIKGNSGTRIVK